MGSYMGRDDFFSGEGLKVCSRSNVLFLSLTSDFFL